MLRCGDSGILRREPSCSLLLPSMHVYRRESKMDRLKTLIGTCCSKLYVCKYFLGVPIRIRPLRPYTDGRKLPLAASRRTRPVYYGRPYGTVRIRIRTDRKPYIRLRCGALLALGWPRPKSSVHEAPTTDANHRPQNLRAPAAAYPSTCPLRAPIARFRLLSRRDQLTTANAGLRLTLKSERLCVSLRGYRRKMATYSRCEACPRCLFRPRARVADEPTMRAS